MTEKDDWAFLKKIKNDIENHLRDREGTITIEQREDKFVLNAVLAKKDKLKLHSTDIPRCLHILR